MTDPTFLDVPACWTWPEPTVRPVPNSSRVVLEWQDGRCGICGERPAALMEDHDHATGDTRGYLCTSCNVREAYSQLPAFELYRERPPFVIVGVLAAYQRDEHPAVRDARVEWQRALGTVEELIDAEQDYQKRARVAEAMRAMGFPEQPAFRTRRAVSPLVRYALRCGFRLNERSMMRSWPMITYPDLTPLALAQVMPDVVPAASVRSGTVTG